MSGRADILFAVSPTNARQEYMPFYFLSLAAWVEKQGYVAAIADPHATTDEENIEAILASIDEHRPRMVGLAAFVTDYDMVVGLARRIKEHAPDLPVIVGNAHASVSPEDFLFEGSPFDLVVRGEGEVTLTEILAAWEPGSRPDHIDGVAFSHGGEVVLTERRELMDISDLPIPAYHLIDSGWYARPTKWVIRRLPASAAIIYTGRGCPFRCAFCAANTVWKANRATSEHPVVRKRPLETVMAELRMLQDTYGFDFFYILDDTFGVRPDDIREFCEAYKASGLSMLWAAETRVPRIDSPQIVAELRDAGCIQLDFGVETGSPRLLELIRKQTAIDDARVAFRLCREGGMRTFANILVNLPTETEDDLRSTDRLLAELKPTVTSFGVTQPYPGTEICRTYVGDVGRADYHELSRLSPPDRWRLAAHDLDLTELLYRCFFKWGVYSLLDRSLYSARPDYWRALLRSNKRFSYLWFFIRETAMSPLRHLKHVLVYRGIRRQAAESRGGGDAGHTEEQAGAPETPGRES